MTLLDTNRLLFVLQMPRSSLCVNKFSMLSMFYSAQHSKPAARTFYFEEIRLMMNSRFIATAVSHELFGRATLDVRQLSYVGLALAMAGSSAVAAEAPATAGGLSPVYVNGIKTDENYDKATPTLDKLTQPIVDTPQSLTVVSQSEMADRGVDNLNDALRTVPGITLGAGETSWQGNNFFLRGFTTRDDMFADGQRDFGYYYRDPFDTEQVEVLKGPSSILFGRGSTGGVINQVSKTPTLDPFLAVTGSLSTADSRRLTLDMDSPVSALGEGAAFRLNVMGDHAEVADRDVTRSDRWGIAPSLALGLGTPTRLVVSFLHQSDDDVPDYGIPWLNGNPAPVDRNNFYGFDSDYFKSNVNVATARVEHDFTPSLTLSSQLRYSRDTREFRYAEAAIPAGTSSTTPAGDITVSRNEFQGFSTDSFEQDQTDLTARFQTGSVSHVAVTGFEVGRESPEPTYDTNVGVPKTNLAAPQDLGYSTTQSYTRLTADTVARTAALYGLDTINIGDRLQIMGGVRWDRFAVRYNSVGYTPGGAVAANTGVNRVDTGFSYRGAVVYKPTEHSSLYATFGTSFDPSAEGIDSLISSGRSVAQANLNLDPEKSRSYEIGSKWDLAQGRVLLTGAAFRLEQYNVRVPDPDNTGFNILGGDQLVKGLEIEVVGRLTDAWKVRAGYTYLDTETVRSEPGGPLLGKPLTITPRNMETLFTEYRVTAPFEIGFGVLGESSRLAQDTAAQYETAPGYVTFNLMAKYEFTPKMYLQVNVNNLANRYYIDQLHPFHAIPGEGRVALFSFTARL
jgi:catecholate siderophore receptor